MTGQQRTWGGSREGGAGSAAGLGLAASGMGFPGWAPEAACCAGSETAAAGGACMQRLSALLAYRDAPRALEQRGGDEAGLNLAALQDGLATRLQLILQDCQRRGVLYRRLQLLEVPACSTCLRCQHVVMGSWLYS